MKVIKGGITAAKGFQSSGVWCGIKKSKLDLALIFSKVPTNCAAVFTKNSVKAAPLIVSQKHVKNGHIQAIVVNSGNANCFTGKFGYVYAEQTTEVIAKLLNINKQDVIVTSTGIIGKPLPFKKIKRAAPKLVKSLTKSGARNAAKAILTTDTCVKECATSFILDGIKITVGGCAKGSGMIAPNMATMLGFISTDVAISKQLLKNALKEAVHVSFNSITVDGCMSTNDMVVVMANAESGNKTITSKGKGYQDFVNALSFVCKDLAKKIVLDGEGASKFIEVNINGAKTIQQAHTIGLKVANDLLVKTACAGSNPNWGRVVAAVGALGISKITEENMKIRFSSFKKRDIKIYVDLNLGKANATVYTSDLTKGYVDINAEYN